MLAYILLGNSKADSFSNNRGILLLDQNRKNASYFRLTDQLLWKKPFLNHFRYVLGLSANVLILLGARVFRAEEKTHQI